MEIVTNLLINKNATPTTKGQNYFSMSIICKG